MTDKNYSFDRVPDRRGTGSYKWDSTSLEGVIPLWVADMDFPTAPVVRDALRRRVDHGIFGYTLVGDDYYKALTGWFSRRHGYTIDRDRVIYTSGVVPAISAIIQALCRPGDGVIVQTPVYNCFFSSVRNSLCRICDAPLRRRDLPDGRFTYDMDFEALEREARNPGTTLMLLCNPHNPAGRAWTRTELERVAEICRENGVRVVSDEIHCDLNSPGTEYVPYGTVDPRCIVCNSPSKAFNTAGLQIANIVCPRPAEGEKDVRALVDKAINVNEVCDVNPFGPVALKASYSPEGEEWLDALRVYLHENYEYLCGVLRRELPQCPVTLLEATYLPWVDISALGLSSETVEEQLLETERVWINAGEMYGEGGFVRLNIATSREILAEGLRRFIAGIRRLMSEKRTEG